MLFVLGLTATLHSQQVSLSPDQIRALTPNWTGERSDDGRPKVSDKWFERMKGIHLEEAWGVLRSNGYQNQFEGDWMVIHPDSAMVGRVVTAQYWPLRPDYDKIMKDKAKKKSASVRRTLGPLMS